MSRKEEKQNFVSTKVEVEFQESVDKLADAVVEDLQEGFASKLEPFDLYKQKVRLDFQQKMNHYRERLTNGYWSMIEELKNEKEIK